jgi:hypothetical protein
VGTAGWVYGCNLEFLVLVNDRDLATFDGVAIGDLLDLGTRSRDNSGILRNIFYGERSHFLSGFLRSDLEFAARKKRNMTGFIKSDLTMSARIKNIIGFLRPNLSVVPRIKKIVGILSSNLSTAKRSQRTIAGQTNTGYSLGNRSKNISGFIPKTYQTGKRIRSRSGFIMPKLSTGIRSIVNNQGVLIETVLFDSNAADHIKLTVTPTFSYESSAIEVATVNSRESTTGKYSLFIGDTESIAYAETSADLTTLSFNLMV